MNSFSPLWSRRFRCRKMPTRPTNSSLFVNCTEASAYVSTLFITATRILLRALCERPAIPTNIAGSEREAAGARFGADVAQRSAMNTTTYDPTRRRYSIVAPVAGGLLCCGLGALGAAAGATVPLDVEIEHPWCATSPKGVTTGACYMTVRNRGTETVRIVGVDIAVSDHTELHETGVADGIMKMRPVSEGVEIPAGTSIDFQTRGYHLMLLDLKSSLKLGQTIDGSLRFESGGAMKIEFHVETRRL